MSQEKGEPFFGEEQGDLETARTVLQAIVNTHEKTINETSPLDRIAGYSTEQVRQAETVVAQSLMDEYRIVKHGFDRKLSKKTPQGILTLSVSDDNVHMHLWNDEKHEGVLRNTYALKQPQQSGAELFYGFDDNRHNDPWTWEKFSETSYRLRRKQSLLSIRYDWRGLRWMNANLLEWHNPETIMPEQLDTLPLPPSQGK
jgi:hypothetical protein